MKYLVLSIKKRKFIVLLFYCFIVLLFSWDVGRYLFNYYRLMVPRYPYSSQYGFSELVPYVESIKKDYERIYVTDRYDQPYILWLFYSQYPPDKFQREVILTPRDKFGFSTVREFDKYYFDTIRDFNQLKSNCGKCLIVGTGEEIPDSANAMKVIRLSGGDKVIFEVVY